MAYSFDGATEADRHETQYFEMFCNRGIYHQGWTAVTRHSDAVGDGRRCRRSTDDVWELYDTNTDWSQAHDLAAEMPEKLAELQQLWLEEARKYNVLPLDDRRIERFNAELVGRPELVKGNSQLLFGGMGRLSENSRPQHQEQVPRGHGGGRRARGGRRGRDHRPGRRLRRLEPVREGRTSDVLLQPARPAALQDRGRRRDPARNAPGADGVRLRRRRPRQGRHRHALPRRRPRSAKAASRQPCR